MNKYKKKLDFFKSALTLDKGLNSTDEIISWIEKHKSDSQVSVEQVPLKLLKKWNFEKQTGNLVHESGKFFFIEGLEVETDWGTKPKWDQPIINQPEVGILGILTKKINGILHFLMQAKNEPGNLNKIQISPTLQATKSNYTRVHKGKKPSFLEYFNGEKKVLILLDQLQSEQGGRFLKKRNRNIIIEVPENESLPETDNFIWLTLGQIKSLLTHDNLVNMDSRSVISGIPFYLDPNIHDEVLKQTLNEKDSLKLLDSVYREENSLNDLQDIISWITRLKSKYELNINKKPLRDLKSWTNDGNIIHHNDNKYFSVIGLSVSIKGREVLNWDQPIIKPSQEGLLGIITKSINGITHFLIQAKLEVGNVDVIEFAPTVQCLTGNYKEGYEVPFIEHFLNPRPEKIIYASMQSEEGGRFYLESNKNIIIRENENFNPKLPENYCWMTFEQMMTFLQFNNYFNMATRSLISAVSILD